MGFKKYRTDVSYLSGYRMLDADGVTALHETIERVLINTLNDYGIAGIRDVDYSITSTTGCLGNTTISLTINEKIDEDNEVVEREDADDGLSSCDDCETGGDCLECELFDVADDEEDEEEVDTSKPNNTGTWNPTPINLTESHATMIASYVDKVNKAIEGNKYLSVSHKLRFLSRLFGEKEAGS